MKRLIIGLSGKKQSGKTTIAEHLCLKLHSERRFCHIVGFADYLKEICVRLYCPIDWNVKDLEGHKEEYRPVLQKLGDAIRSVNDNCLIHALKWRLKHIYPYSKIVIIPDVRRIDEMKWIHSQGGIVIRLTRCPHPEDKHATETEMDSVEKAYLSMYFGKLSVESAGDCFDYIIDNQGLTIKEQNKTAYKIVRARAANAGGLTP